MAEPWAAKFYNSKEWKDLRGQLIVAAKYTCQKCGKNLVLNPSRLVGHHKIKLDPKNILDVNISLNPQNIEIICKECHDEEHKRYRYSGSHNVYLVYGAPCAGKSTWVNQTAERGDLLLDMDAVFYAISGCPMYDHPKNLNKTAYAVRDTILEQIRMRAGAWHDAYVIGGYPRKLQRETLAGRLGAEVVYIETTPEEAKARAMTSRGALAGEWCGYIDKWFKEFSL
ncbi:MAG: HNH endonuclease [Selenomonadaceae bacterium]|nr:HNH endonuclease [Selenomonadaceae bacterium]